MTWHGNIKEWTQEASGVWARESRGGDYDVTGTWKPVTSNNINSPDGSMYDVKCRY